MSIKALADYAKYDSYKHSGGEWLGDIPESWKLGRISSYFHERRKKVSDKEYPALSVTKSGVFPQWEHVAKSNDSDNRKLVKKGDFVINSRSDRKGSSGIAKQDGSVSLINIVLKAKEIEPRYSEYLFKSNAFIEEFYRMGHGIVADLWTTRFDNIKNSMMPVPTYAEQTAIADFLDRKTIQLDQAIDLKQQQIERLNEYKQIVIQNAVSKGLNRNTQMKDSGIDWIGDIPEHWEVKSLKRLAKISPRIDFSKTQVDDLVSFLPMEKVSVDGVIDCEIKKPLKEVKQGFTAFQRNDVILAKITPCFENGKGALLDKLDTDIGFGSTEFHVLRAGKNISNKYLYIVTQSHLFLNVGEKMMTGSAGHKRVPTDFVANFPVALPSIEEQHQIVIFIDELNKKTLNTIGTLKIQIERLKEYKTILINQAVTGKIKVS